MYFGIGFINFRLWARTIVWPDSHVDPHSNTDANEYTYSYFYINANEYSHLNSYANEYSHPNSYAHSYSTCMYGARRQVGGVWWGQFHRFKLHHFGFYGDHIFQRW